MTSIEREAPVLHEPVIKEFYAEKDINMSRKCRVLDQGYRRIARRTFLVNFRYLAPNTRARLNRCAFRFDCPRSMHSTRYPVYVHCETRQPVLPERLPRITKVLAVWCCCIAMGDGKCVHGAALLYVVHNLKRGADEEKPPPTSKECKWNMPRESVIAYDNTVPIAKIPFERAERDGTKKRQCVAHEQNKGRHEGDWPKHESVKNRKRNAEEPYLNDLKQLFDVAEKHLGQPCALATVYDPSLPIHTETDFAQFKSQDKSIN